MNRLQEIRRSFVVMLSALMVAMMLPTATHAAGGWYAEYFSNRDLSGGPAVVRTDANIDFNWGVGSPDPQIPADNFSARWTQTLHLEEGQYVFSATADDGVRLFVDGALVINDWRESANATRTGAIDLGAGTHTLRLEYFEQTGQAAVRLSWERKPIVRPIGNIITYAEPGTWVRIYRRMPNGEWQYMNPGGTGPIDASGRIKIDGLPVEPFYGDRGQPYRVELWTQGRILRTVGDLDNGQPAFIVYPFRDNYTPWGPSPVTPQQPTPTPSPTPKPDGSGTVDGSYTGTLINARGLNVRRGPGVGYGVVTTIRPNQIVELTGYRNASATWIQIRANGVTGWVNAYYIRTSAHIRSLTVAR